MRGVAREVAEFVGISVVAVWAFFGLLFLGIAATIIVLLFKPTFMNLERDAIKHSHQYVESHRTALMKFAEDYREAESDLAKYELANKNTNGDYDEVIEGTKGHMSALKKRMREEAGRVPDDQVPQEVKDILSE